MWVGLRCKDWARLVMDGVCRERGLRLYPWFGLWVSKCVAGQVSIL